MLASCIMPTADRRRFVPDAIRRFLAQDHPAKELIVVDDGDDPVRDLVPNDPRLRYLHIEPRHLLGHKRNFCCALARGEIIAHWDDDDYYAPWRLSRQVKELELGFDLCGLDRPLIYDRDNDEAWESSQPPGARTPWVFGATFAYRKALWKVHPFDDNRHNGEDTDFVWRLDVSQVSAMRDQSMYVGLMHAANTGYHRAFRPSMRQLPVTRIAEIMGEDRFAGYPGSPEAHRQRNAP
jgi:glycosyltransferase involved in cell wall biosynthesis